MLFERNKLGAAHVIIHVTDFWQEVVNFSGFYLEKVENIKLFQTKCRVTAGDVLSKWHTGVSSALQILAFFVFLGKPMHILPSEK